MSTLNKRKIAYVISDIDKALSFEWLASHLQKDYNLLFILIGKKKSVLASFLASVSIPFHEVDDKSYPSYISKWIKVFNILRLERPEIVHTHLWRANLIGLSAAWVLRVKRRIFTRHHGTLHYTQFPSGRKWDLLCNRIATDIIAISKNIETILTEWDKASPAKITLIHHGFDLNYFISVTDDEVDLLREKYGLSRSNHPVIGVISRYMEWKGIQYIIPAFKNILGRFPAAKLVLANAHGEFKKEISLLLQDIPSDSVIEIAFEQNLAALYKLFDVFVHVPIDPHVEAFGQTYIEALAAGVPSVFTLSGIAAEIIKHKQNAWVVNFKQSDEIAMAILEMESDRELKERMVTNGKRTAQQFSFENHILALKDLYNKEYS